MPDELHTPDHRWYQGRYHIPLAKEDHSKQWIFASGISKIDAWIDLLAGRDYSILGFEPEYVADFANERYRVQGASTPLLSDAINHSASSNATMVDSDGLLKWRPHNLLTYSEQFDNGTWNKFSVTVTANATVSPDGTTTADLVANDGAIYQSGLVMQVATNYTFKVWAKGVVGGETFRFSYKDSIEVSPTQTVTTEWQLFEWTSQTAFGTDARALRDTVGDIYFWGAHLYRSDLGGMVAVPVDARATPSATTYVPTTSDAVYLPRRGHHVYNGTSWVNEGLLHESEQRVNLLTYSEDFTDASWTKSKATIISDAAVSPIRQQVYRFAEDGSTGEHLITHPATKAASSLVYTASVVAKRGAGSRNIGVAVTDGVTGGYAAIFNPDDGSIVLEDQVVGSVAGWTAGDARVEDLGGGWWRFSYSATTNAATRVDMVVYAVSGTSRTYLGDGSSYHLVTAAQLEAGSTPSSHIPTSGATVTRAAETLTIPSAKLPWPTPNVIGPELVTNGTFDTDSDWTPSNCTISVVDGVATLTASAAGTAYITQTFSMAGSKVYALNASFSGGTLNLYDTGAFTGFLTGFASGQERIYYLADTDGTVSATYFWTASGAGDTVTIDNISVREIDPLAVSIAMEGRMTHADDGTSTRLLEWTEAASARIEIYTRTGAEFGKVSFYQQEGAVADRVDSGVFFSEGINVAFNIASRHGSTFINGAVDGTALTADTTPTALPDLETTDLSLGDDYMGTIRQFRMWSDDLADAGIAEAST